jgi:hypothetical protein
MKDLLGFDIEPGDFVISIRTNGYKMPALVHGGITQGGSVRCLLLFGSLGKAPIKEKFLLKVDFEVFKKVSDDKLEHYKSEKEKWNLRFPDERRRNDSYDRIIEKIEDNYLKFIKIRTEDYNKEL